MKKKCKLTILTSPVTAKANIKRIIRKTILHRPYYGGHFAVTRSLIEGLTNIGFDDFNYQPWNENEIGEYVHVLAGVNTLRYAIELKKKGKIKRLTAGPNVVVFSDDFDSIIASKEVDMYLQPSEWSKNYHIACESKMKDRCLAWPAGIKIERYSYDNSKRNMVLIYHKDESKQFLYRVDYLLRSKGYSTAIVEYGNYSFNDYIEMLRQSIFAVFISRQESQGLCLAEAWAMNVPTLCFEPNYYRWVYPNKQRELQGDISTAPYLTGCTGATWFELSELEFLIDNYNEVSKTFSPRKWVEENMTDEICAQKFLDVVGISYK